MLRRRRLRLGGAAGQVHRRFGDAAPDQCWTGKFKEDQPGGRELRIFWSWYGDGGLRASDNPRWDFAHLPALYKLYVIRETGGRTTTLDNDPSADFLRRLLPEASRVLSQP